MSELCRICFEGRKYSIEVETNHIRFFAGNLYSKLGIREAFGCIEDKEEEKDTQKWWFIKWTAAFCSQLSNKWKPIYLHKNGLMKRLQSSKNNDKRNRKKLDQSELNWSKGKNKKKNRLVLWVPGCVYAVHGQKKHEQKSISESISWSDQWSWVPWPSIFSSF